MRPRFAFLQSEVARRSQAVALSAALLAVPLVVAHPAAASLLLAASALGAAVLLERWPAPDAPAREIPRPSPSLALVRSRSPQPCPRWELVDRDGRRSLEMRWR